MPQKLLYSECKYGRLVAGQQPFEAVCPCCLTTMLIEACCQVDCGINADVYPLQTANNQNFFHPLGESGFIAILFNFNFMDSGYKDS